MPRQVVGSVTPDAKGQPALQSLNRELVRIWQAINALQGNSGKVATATGQVIDGDLQVNGQVSIGTTVKPGILNIQIPSGDVKASSLSDPIAEQIGQQCSELHILGQGSVTFFDRNGTPVDPICTIGVVREASTTESTQVYTPIGYISIKPIRYVPLDNALNGTSELTLAYPGIDNDILGNASKNKTVFGEPFFPSDQNSCRQGTVHIYNQLAYERGLTVTGTLNAIPTWIGYRQSSSIAGPGKYTWDAFWPVGAPDTSYTQEGEIGYRGTTTFPGVTVPFSDIHIAAPGVYRVHFWTLNTAVATLPVQIMFCKNESATPTTWQLVSTFIGGGSVSGTLDAIVTIKQADLDAAYLGIPPYIYVQHTGAAGQARYGHATEEVTGLIVEKIGGYRDDTYR